MKSEKQKQIAAWIADPDNAEILAQVVWNIIKFQKSLSSMELWTMPPIEEGEKYDRSIE
jgi:hypothetical protein